jgi:hypothetical protein
LVIKTLDPDPDLDSLEKLDPIRILAFYIWLLPQQEEPEQEEDAELLTVHLDPLQAGGATGSCFHQYMCWPLMFSKCFAFTADA